MEPEFDATEEIVEFMEAMSPERAALLKIRCEKAIEKRLAQGQEADLEEICVFELKLMYLADIMEELKAKGLVEITGINDSGELVYRAVRPS